MKEMEHNILLMNGTFFKLHNAFLHLSHAVKWLRCINLKTISFTTKTIVEVRWLSERELYDKMYEFLYTIARRIKFSF